MGRRCWPSGGSTWGEYKIPSEIVFTHTPFVRNAVGKIDKAALRRAHADA